MQTGYAQTNRIVRRLADAAGRGALLPYLTGGYPGVDATAEWIKRFDVGGVAAIEIGFPYSDSIADGPVIQESFYRALARGLKIDDLFEMVHAVRPAVDVGLIAMVSFSIVRRMGVERFTDRAAECGFDGLIVPDVPHEEADEVIAATAARGLCNAMLVAPTTSPERAEQIARRSTGFVYQVAARGITGERDRLPADLRVRVERLRSVADLPVCVGFGVSSAAHVRQVCEAADGAIVGSAIVRRITDALDTGESHDTIIERVAEFVDELSRGVG